MKGEKVVNLQMLSHSVPYTFTPNFTGFHFSRSCFSMQARNRADSLGGMLFLIYAMVMCMSRWAGTTKQKLPIENSEMTKASHLESPSEVASFAIQVHLHFKSGACVDGLCPIINRICSEDWNIHITRG